MASKVIHPAAQARATRMGCTIVAEEVGFKLMNNETGLKSEDTFDKVAEATEELARSGIDNIVWEKAPRPNGLRSGVMVASYHSTYSKNPGGPGCNDDLDLTLRDATQTDKGTMDADLLREIGVASGLYSMEWERLNNGFRRMNLANKMRGFLRNNPNSMITIGDKTGRFGILPGLTKDQKKHARQARRVAVKELLA